MDAITCRQCKKKNLFLTIQDRAGGQSSYQYGDGKMKHGYLPEFSSITSGDGCEFKICVGCGWISGLNLETLRKQIKKEFAEDSDEELSKEETLKKSKTSKTTGSKTNKKESGSKTNKKESGSKTKKVTTKESDKKVTTK